MVPHAKSALLRVLPHGTGPSEEAFAARHRAIVAIVWCHVPVLAAVALLAGAQAPHALLHPVPVVALAILAGRFAGRRARSTSAAAALLTCSALLVHSLDGLIEAHFHFFVVLTVLAVYEDWATYGLALGYVVVHHGLAGTALPYRVFDHPGAEQGLDAWKWAGVHGIFFALAVGASLALWKLNERSREAALGEVRARVRAEAITETLARGLRPDELPRLPGVRIAARYAPGGGHVGGDWYDVISLPGDRLLVALGDVAGHGPDAAGLSARLRHILRAYAEDGLTPAQLLFRLDRAVGDTTTTAACLLLDPVEGRMTYAIAGHLPPVIRHPDGTVRTLTQPRTLPLAGLGGVREEVTEALEEGCTITLYTDGLVERRDETLERGLDRLTAAIARIGAAPDDIAERLCEALAPAGGDDVTVLAIQVDAARGDGIDGTRAEEALAHP